MKERTFEDYFKIFKRDVTRYIDLKYEYFKLEFVELFSTIFSKILSLGVVLLISIIAFSFVLIAVAFYLGKLLGAYHYGFLIVAAGFFLIAILFVLLRNVIITNPLINSLISALFNNEIEKEEKKENEEKSK